METHDTREVEEWREQFRSCFDDLPDEYECCSGKDCNCNGATVFESIETFIHHQLQKARQDWLRELEEVMRVDIGDASPTRLALQTLLDRYHSELDQPTDPDGKPLCEKCMKGIEPGKVVYTAGHCPKHPELDQDNK